MKKLKSEYLKGIGALAMAVGSFVMLVTIFARPAIVQAGYHAWDQVDPWCGTPGWDQEECNVWCCDGSYIGQFSHSGDTCDCDCIEANPNEVCS